MIEKHYNYTPYAYVYNNPIRLTDPFGLDSTDNIRNSSFASISFNINKGVSVGGGIKLLTVGGNANLNIASGDIDISKKGITASGDILTASAGFAAKNILDVKAEAGVVDGSIGLESWKFSADGKLLYMNSEYDFNDEGHYEEGGFDKSVTPKKNESWSKPSGSEPITPDDLTIEVSAKLGLVNVNVKLDPGAGASNMLKNTSRVAKPTSDGKKPSVSLMLFRAIF